MAVVVVNGLAEHGNRPRHVTRFGKGHPQSVPGFTRPFRVEADHVAVRGDGARQVACKSECAAEAVTGCSLLPRRITLTAPDHFGIGRDRPG